MQHLDEGTIHAWLDGQLPPGEGEAVEAHVAECRSCADAVAEARGLIAASSRILTALDGVPRGVMPKPAVQRARRRWLTGPSLAAAATILVAVGTFAVVRNADERSMVSESADTAALAAGPSADGAEARPNAQPVPTVAVAPSGAASAASAPANDAAPAESRRLASGARSEVDPEQRTKALADLGKRSATTEAAVGNVQASGRDEAKRTLPPVSRRDDDMRLAKERSGFAAGDTSRARQLATVQRGSGAEQLQARKPDTTTVTIMRGSSIAQARVTPAPAAPAPAAPVPPPPAAVDPRDVRADAAAAGQSGAARASVRGRVTDGNNTGLSAVQVTILGTNTGTTTNDRGEFVLGGIAPGEHRLVVRRIGYDAETRAITLTAGQTLTADVVLRPTVTSLNEVVVTSSASPPERRSAGSSIARSAPSPEAAPGAAVTATESNAIGCYEFGITSSTPRPGTGLRQVPRRVALDGEIVPANADGVWYRARDLSRTGALPDGLWRPVGTDGVELEWTYGTRIARIRLTGPARAMMRGTVDEIDRGSGTSESGSVVTSRRSCDG
jgi:hypothetical protein